ncbi:hypothetical protein [Coleofasciculus sp.]|uniref:hypothetical protein n=1 Tax=Coleofasciculus sp. TaxID=3100458 RepID=UPI004062FEA1
MNEQEIQSILDRERILGNLPLPKPKPFIDKAFDVDQKRLDRLERVESKVDWLTILICWF